MAFKLLTTATNAAIARNIAVAELKHTARVEDIQLELARKSEMRLAEHARKLTEAKHAHAVWHNNLDEAGKQMFADSLQTLKAVIAPKPDSE